MARIKVVTKIILLVSLLVGVYLLIRLNSGASEIANYQFDSNSIPDGVLKGEILYGRSLIVDTAALIGPRGRIRQVTGTRMNCAHCHIDGGTKVEGLPFLDTHGLYPQYRSREGRVLSLADRINACITMPMLGSPLAADSREMQAMILYIRQLGVGRKVLELDPDQRLAKIEFPMEAGSPERGERIFQKQCASCHGDHGQGQLDTDEIAFRYPPLWGAESYRVGSSMHRVSIAARFIKANMPHGIATSGRPVLTDLEAIDVASYINFEERNPRPGTPNNLVLYPDIRFKPFDFPAAPYADTFSPSQHRWGPFREIHDYYAAQNRRLKASVGDLNGP